MKDTKTADTLANERREVIFGLKHFEARVGGVTTQKRSTRLLRAVFGIAVICLMLAGCGSEKEMPSAKALTVGKKALAITDQYLDMDIDSSDASKQLDDLYKELDYVSDQKTTDDHHAQDLGVQIDISGIQIDMTYDNFDSSSDSYDDLLEKRNKLAEDIGESKR